MLHIGPVRTQRICLPLFIMIRNHIQRLTGWNVPNITISTSNDDENVENSDYGNIAGNGVPTKSSFDSATDENHVTTAIAITTNTAITGSMPIDENSILSSQNLPPNKNSSLRRTSDGSDGLTISSPALAEKENQTISAESATGNISTGIRHIQLHPPSPFGTVSNRHTYRTQSPLSTATSSNTNGTQYFSSVVQSPKNHLYTGTTFETYSHTNKISTTPLSSSSPSSPRRSTKVLSQDNTILLNSPRYNSKHFSSQSYPTSSYEDSTDTNILPNPTSSESLYRVNEIVSVTSSGSESQPMNDFKTETAISPSADCDTASNKTATSDHTAATALCQSELTAVLLDEQSTSESYHSENSGPSKLIDQTTESEDETIVSHIAVADLSDKYKWAYDVWKKHGLLMNRDCKVQSSSNVPRRLHNEATNDLPRAGSHHLLDYTKHKKPIYTGYSKSKDSKPWNNDRVGSFSNILDKWKSKTEEQPFDSPGSCTVMQRASLQPTIKAQPQPRKLCYTGASGNDASISSSLISNVKHVEVESVKPKWKPSSSNIKSNQPSIYSNQHVRHPSASLPIKEFNEDSLQGASSSPVPKSQAWKLKASRDLRLLERSTDPSDHRRTSWNPNTSIIDRSTESAIKVSESKTCKSSTNASFERTGNNHRSKSTLRYTVYSIPSVIEHSLTKPESSAVDVPKQSIDAVRRSKSQPRDRQTYRTTAAKSISENNFVDLQKKHSSNTIDTTDVMRVIDLDISSGNENYKDEMQSISMQLDDDAVTLSPYTQRLMRNLAKIYNESDNIKTPRVSETTMRPWQHDRLLHRVGSISEESNQEECCQCSCSHSIFSGSDDLIEFFLPLMGTACTCGKTRTGINDAKQPTSLANILRPWQVEFLSRFGIYCGEELVKSFHRSGLALAKAMLKYRKNEGMTPFPLKSCMMALQIWSKTSKTFVRSIRDQLSQRNNSDVIHSDDDKTELKLPNTLYILSSFMEKVQQDDDDDVNKNNTFILR